MGLSATTTSDRRSEISSHLFFFILTVFLLFNTIASRAEIEVNTYGVRSAKSSDTAMIFYANVEHRGSENSPPIAARLHMEKCCLNVPPNRTNCEAVKLISGLARRLRAHQFRTLEMYFVNVDVLDREGSCVLRLLTKRIENYNQTEKSRGKREGTSWERGRDITIPFKTSLAEPTWFEKFLISMGWSSKGYKICSSDNKNAAHECANHDCLLRYAGAMSVHDHDTKQCQTTMACGNSTKQMLSPITGKCEVIRTELQDGQLIRSTYTEEMKKIDQPWYYSLITEPEIEVKKSTSLHKPIKNIKCEHGILVRRPPEYNLNCSCHTGWRSPTREEWEQKGGSLDPDGTAPMHNLCNIPTIEHGKRKTLLITFFVIACLVPVVAFLICLIRKQLEDNEKSMQGKSKSIKEPLTTPSSDEEQEHEHESGPDHEEEKEKRKKREEEKEKHDCGSAPPPPNGFVKDEEDDAEKIIMEIANRREQRPKRIESKEDPKPPPPPPSPSTAPPHHQEDDDPPPPPPSSHGSTANHAEEVIDINSIMYEKPSSGPSQTPSSATKSTTGLQSATHLEPGASKSTQKIEVARLQRSSSSIGFDINSDLLDADEVNMNFPCTSPLINMEYSCTRSLSTDELLTMKAIEKMVAHIPMQPVSASTSQSSLKSTLVELDSCNNNSWSENNAISKIHSFSSLSSEEITLRKKQQWDQFIESVSKASLASNKPDHHTIQVDVDDDNNNNNPTTSCSNFSYFSKTPPQQFKNIQSLTTAIKVRSLPEMQSSQYVALPIPPEQFIYKSLKEMPPDEYAKRQEAYNILHSLSNSKIGATSEMEILQPVQDLTIPTVSACVKHQDFVPASITASMKDSTKALANVPIVSNSVEHQDLGRATETRSVEEVRIESIYGDMGSDADSEEALEAMSSSKSTMNTRQTVAEQFEENQRQYRASLMRIPQKQPETFGVIQSADLNRNVNKLIESDYIPSDSYPANSSAPASSSSSSEGLCTKNIPEKSEKLSGWLQEYFYSREGTGLAREPTSDTKGSLVNIPKDDASESGSLMTFETETAYGIKASLENVLKASKSRSATHHF